MSTAHHDHVNPALPRMNLAASASIEARCRMQFESTPMPTLLWTFADQRFRLADLNRAAEQWSQDDTDRLIGLAADEIYQDRPDIIKLFHRCVAERSVIVHETTLHLRSSSDDRIVEMTFAYVSPEMLLLHINDITAHRMAETALRNEQAKLRALLENTDSAIWSVDRNCRLIVGNTTFHRSVEKTIGYTMEVGSVALASEHAGEVNDEWRRYYDRALRGERFSVEQLQPYLNPPQWIEFRFAPIQDDQGSITGVTVLGQNTTERKLSDTSLRESEERFRLAFESANDGVCLVGLDGKLLRVNARMSEIFGYSKLELEQMTVNDIAHPDYRDVSPKFIRQAIAGVAGRNEFEKAYIHRSGSTVWARVSSSLVHDDAGEPLYFISHVQDITERKLAEHEREQLQTQLYQSQKMETIGRLAGGIAHDFNNLLAVILIRSEMSMAMTDPNSTLHRNLATIYNTAQRSADLVRQLLAFARKQVTAPQVLDLNQAIETLLPMLQPLIGEEIELLWHPAPALWAVEMDPAQINQVLVNLCVNASDAIDGIGLITIATANAVLDDAVGANGLPIPAGEYVIISVSDSGAGIAEDTLPHIFEPFFTTKEVGKGSGLGLATVEGIVQQNGGHIQVVSAPGKGATFTILLPRFVNASSENVRSQIQTLLHGNGETLLVVEDEATVLQMMTDILSSIGYRVLVAGAPSEALRMIGETSVAIDLLVTDIVMPEMNGRDLARRIADLRPGIKVLYISGYPAETIAHRRVDDRKMVFLQKPFSLSTLAAKVRLALESDSRV